MNKILCFDTSNNRCHVSVSHGQNILAYNQDLRPSMQAEILLPMIEKTMKQAGFEYSDLDCLAVTKGPGSFTGIRIGLAVATSIVHAADIEGMGIDNFAAHYYLLKLQVSNFNRAFVILNAYRNQQYVQEFDLNGAVGEAKIYGNAELVHLLQQQKKEEVIVCCGSGLSLLYSQIKHQENLLLLPKFSVIKAYHIARLADKLLLQGKIMAIEPLYIRPADADLPSS